jgi:hypothetical protein
MLRHPVQEDTPMTQREAGITQILITLAVLLGATTACADEVTSKGTVLRGKVTAISADNLSFETEYGKGAIVIKWADIEDVRTDGSFQVLYGDGLTLYAPLQGISGENLLVGDAPESATQVELTSIHSGQPIGPDGPSFIDRERAFWRYWDGSLDFGLNVQQATVDTTGFLLGFKTVRRNAPTRFYLEANYRYATQKKKGESQTTIEDRAFGLIRGEYDLTDRLYLFGSGDVTYDAIQKLSIRGVPKGGVGYLFWEEKLDEEKRNFLSGEVGVAWVYEQFFAERVANPTPPPRLVEPPEFFTPSDNFVAVAFGLAAGYHLPYGAHIGYRGDYLPAIEDWTHDYLLRNALELTLPLYGPIAAKFTLLDEYDSTPAPDTDHNSLFLTFGLSILW